MDARGCRATKGVAIRYNLSPPDVLSTIETEIERGKTTWHPRHREKQEERLNLLQGEDPNPKHLEEGTASQERERERRRDAVVFREFYRILVSGTNTDYKA